MDHFFKVCIVFVTILFLFYLLVFWPRGMWDLSSLTRDQTCTPCIGRRSLNHWTAREVPAFKKYIIPRGFPVAQWLRVCLPMQGTRVWALVREDTTCCGATRPLRHSYWACALEPMSHNDWSPWARSPSSAAGEATAVRGLCNATKSSSRLPQLNKAHAQQQRLNTPKNK